MVELLIADKTFELVLQENAEKKRKELGVEEFSIQALIERNPEAVLESLDNESVLISGDISITFYKKDNRVVVSNLYGANQVL